MKRIYDSNPAWSGPTSSSTRRKTKKASRKRRQMATRTRASLRLRSSMIRKKRIAERTKEKAVKIRCNTRTVELAAAQPVGEDKNKLLFMLAIGLVPNLESKCEVWPSVKLETIDPDLLAMARARTRKVVTEIAMRKQAQLSQQRIAFHQQFFQSTLWEPTYTPYCPIQPPQSDGDVEVIDLVSSDEEEPDTSDTDIEILPPPGPSSISRCYPAVLCGLHSSKKHKPSMRNAAGPLKTTSPSPPRARRFALKPLVNNQEVRKSRNWNPESTTRKSDFEKSETSTVSALNNVCQSKLPSSFKSIPARAGSRNRHVRGIHKDKSCSSPVPDAIITID